MTKMAEFWDRAGYRATITSCSSLLSVRVRSIGAFLFDGFSVSCHWLFLPSFEHRSFGEGTLSTRDCA